MPTVRNKKPAATKRALNEKQLLFANEYVIDLCATHAAMRAGYSEKTAYSQGQRLLKHVEVQKAIQAAMHKREKRIEITQDKVLLQIAKVAFADLTEFVTWNKEGINIKPSDEVDGTVLAEVSEDEIEFADGFTKRKKKVKLPDRMKALEMLGRHLGLFDRQKGSGYGNGMLDALTEAIKQSKEALEEGDADE